MAEDPWLGTELAGYRLDTVVGRGGSGVVYRATHLRLGRAAAVKLLAGGVAADPEYQRRFEREAGLVANLQHPHIVPIYDAGHAQGVLYMAMAYIDGPNLATLLTTEGPMGPHRVAALLGGVAEALDSAHRAGLVHRDVKPANILVAPAQPAHSQRGYLCDFGIARRTAATTGDGLTSTGQFLGTLQYCAPEQIQGHSLDGRADQYALACVVYQCLTGQAPYPADELAAIMFAHVSAEPPRPSAHHPDLPAELDAVIARALAKNPDDRFPSSVAFLHALTGAITVPSAESRTAGAPAPAGASTLIWPPGNRAQPPATSPATPPATTAPLPRRGLAWLRELPPVERRKAIAAGVVVALLVVAGIFYAHGRTDHTMLLLGTDQRGEAPFGPDLVVDGSVTPTARFDPASGRDPSGDQDGLYFDATGTSSCNREPLRALLQKDSTLAAAWGGALGATATDAAGLVSTLTPARLRADVQVTAFGYSDGDAVPHPAVLQAGTAVLIDGRGLPTVVCADSDPLTAPTPVEDPDYTGTPWPGFNPADLITIHPAGTVVRQFGLLNPAGTTPFRRPPGSDGTSDIAQTPTTGRLDGHYVFTGPMTHCDRYETCKQDSSSTFVMDATFSDCINTCTLLTNGVRNSSGDGRENIGKMSLTRVSDRWTVEYTVTGACATRLANGRQINSWPRVGKQHITITVTKSAVVDRLWKATEASLEVGSVVAATEKCPFSDRTFSLTGTAQ